MGVKDIPQPHAKNLESHSTQWIGILYIFKKITISTVNLEFLICWLVKNGKQILQTVNCKNEEEKNTYQMTT